MFSMVFTMLKRAARTMEHAIQEIQNMVWPGVSRRGNWERCGGTPHGRRQNALIFRSCARGCLVLVGKEQG
jgi:hypothetical protein